MTRTAPHAIVRCRELASRRAPEPERNPPILKLFPDATEPTNFQTWCSEPLPSTGDPVPAPALADLPSGRWTRVWHDPDGRSAWKALQVPMTNVLWRLLLRDGGASD